MVGWSNKLWLKWLMVPIFEVQSKQKQIQNKKVIGSDTLTQPIQPKYWLRLQAKQTEPPMLKIMCSYLVTSTASR
jgi:hypothetical protein